MRREPSDRGEHHQRHHPDRPGPGRAAGQEEETAGEEEEASQK